MIDAAVHHQTIDGFGTAFYAFDDPRSFFDSPTGRVAPVMTTAQQNEILDLIYQDLRLSRVRPTSPDAANADIESTNDNDNPYITDLSRFNFTGARLDANLDYFAQARLRGADTLFLSPISRETWMGTSTNEDVEEYAEWLLAQVRRAKQLRTPLQYLSVAHEPSGDSNPISGEFTRDVIKNLGPRLRMQGFEVQFVVPVDAQSREASLDSQIILSDPEALSYVGALATHLGGQSVVQISEMEAIANQHHLPLWVSDSSVSDLNTVESASGAIEWAGLVHELVSNYDVSAVDYQWGFGGAADGETSALITLHASEDSYTGYTLNKSYFAFGQYSRFVVPGAQRIDVQSTDDDVKSTAFLSESELVIVAINSSDTSQDVTFDLRGVSAVQFSRIRTSLTENWAMLPNVDVEETIFMITLPAHSIETLTTDLAENASGDFDENGDVNSDDLAIWIDEFGRTTDVVHSNGDANGDLVVDGADLLNWQRDFGAPTEMQGDFNGIAGIDLGDLVIWQEGYGMVDVASPRQGDADGDLDVDGADFLLWQRNVTNVGGSVVSGEAVPEPMSIVMCVLGIMIGPKPNRR